MHSGDRPAETMDGSRHHTRATGQVNAGTLGKPKGSFAFGSGLHYFHYRPLP
jgi:hypothetical protein